MLSLQPSSGRRVKWEVPRSALFCEYSYRLRSASSEYDAYEICKNPHHRTGNEHKDQNPGNALFQIGILPKEMTCIKQEPDKKNNPEKDGKNHTDGIGNTGYRIFNPANLCEKWE